MTGKHRKHFVIFFLVLLPVGTGVIVTSCAKRGDVGNTYADTLSVYITTPPNGSTVARTLTIRAEATYTPDYIEFHFDTFRSVYDSFPPYSATYDVMLYPQGNYFASAVAYWGDITRGATVSFYIYNNICDPGIPVVLNGDTIPESRILRNQVGCITRIDLRSYGITDSNCLSGLELYGAELETLFLFNNQLQHINLSPLTYCRKLRKFEVSMNRLESVDLLPLSNCRELIYLSFWANQIMGVDLSPLSSCTLLSWLDFRNNQLRNIDLTPLWELNRLSNLFIQNNFLDSVSCLNVCAFISNHPACRVYTDCSCAK